jgi:inorganic pyrophosphatase
MVGNWYDTRCADALDDVFDVVFIVLNFARRVQSGYKSVVVINIVKSAVVITNVKSAVVITNVKSAVVITNVLRLSCLTWQLMRRTCLLFLLLPLLACSKQDAAPRLHLLNDHAAMADSVFVNVVVEIPAGTNEKWQVDKNNGALEWEQENGAPRVVQYLAYPGNYGIIPQTLLPAELGGDGDPLDVVLLGPSHPKGTVVPARVIGVLRLIDRGERDDKVLAVGVSGPLSDAHTLEALDARYPGVRTILETWFTHYKGVGVATSNGFASADSAMMVVREASRYFKP